MVKSNYWEKREREWIEKNIHADADTDKLLEAKFDDLEVSLYKDIQGFYVNYAKSQNITMAEAKKKAASFDVKAFEKEAKKLVETKDFSKEANERLKLYNATMRINRQQALAAKVGLSAASVMNDTEGIIRDKLENDILNEHKHQAGLLGMTIPERIDLRGQALIDGSYQGAKWSERLWVNSDAMVSDVTNIINRSLIQGMNPNQLASKLRPYLNKSVTNAKYAAQRLARTESARISTEYKQLLYKDQGYTKGKWIAESSACKICLPKDGKIFKLDDIDVPIHPNCRCSFVPYFEYKHSKINGDQNGDESDVTGMLSSSNENILNELQNNGANEFNKVLNNAPKNLKELFYKNRDKVQFVKDSSVEGAYYSNNKIVIGNLARTTGTPVQTIVHEMGHAIEGYSGGKGIPIKRHIYKRILKRSTQDISYPKITTAAMEDKYHLAETITKEAEKVAKPLFEKYDINSNDGVPSVGWEQWRNENIKSKADWNKYGDFSDIIQAGTNEKVNLGVGHDVGYWKDSFTGHNDKGKKVKFRTGNGSQEQEFFAEVTQSVITNPESYEILKKNFPESIKIYDQIVKDLLKDEV